MFLNTSLRIQMKMTCTDKSSIIINTINSKNDLTVTLMLDSTVFLKKTVLVLVLCSNGICSTCPPSVGGSLCPGIGGTAAPQFKQNRAKGSEGR